MRNHRSMFPLLSIGALALAMAFSAHADSNAYSAMLQNNAMRQANDAADDQPGRRAGWLSRRRCRPCAVPASVRAAAPAPASVARPPITATDFVPARPGHPFVDQAIAGMTALTPEQRVQMRNGAEELFRRVATQYRGNNLAVSVTVAYAAALLTLNGTDMKPQQTREFVFNINDQLVRHPRFASMTPLEKQTESDRLIFQTFAIAMLRDLGTHDPQAREQATELARTVMKQFNGG